MRWVTVVSSLLASTAAVSAGRRSIGHAGKHVRELWEKTNHARSSSDPTTSPYHVKRGSNASTGASVFLNANTTKFAVNGSGIPEVDFDVGESYAGTLPISDDPNERSSLFFWFFPSTNAAAGKEMLIWLNGGPGCSSLEGFLQENGPFLWQYGTFKPYANPWSWHTLTNMIWVDQPVGTGFSTGQVTATSEEDVAAQFMGFWKNFIDAFGMQGYKVYIAGESYAGMYCPYIASAFLDAKDTTYYDMRGMIIYDALITYRELQQPVVTVPFVDYWRGLFPFNDTFNAWIHKQSKQCGFADYLDKYLVYPPTSTLPTAFPGSDSTGTLTPECLSVFDRAYEAILYLNPCFDIYQVATTCPVLWDVLGFPGSAPYTPAGADIYFNRTDVKAAIHAPMIEWNECSIGEVFVNGSDSSPWSSLAVLPGVIDRTKNVIIGHGALDMFVMANGTLLAIQNMTWGGKLGFQTAPTEPFFVPYHGGGAGVTETLAGAGVFGTVHTERGLTWVSVDVSGHMVPQYAPSAAYRHVEYLLGRVGCMNCTVPFTSQPGYAQPASSSPPGLGTAPAGYSDSSSSSGSAATSGAARRRGVAAAPWRKGKKM